MGVLELWESSTGGELGRPQHDAWPYGSVFRFRSVRCQVSGGEWVKKTWARSIETDLLAEREA